MAKEEEPLGSGGVDTVGVTVPEKDATAGGVTMTAAGSDDVEVGPGEPLVPLQDPWYCSSLLLGLSTGRSGSGLCPTRNRPDQIGWANFQPAADRRRSRFGRVRRSTSGGRVRSESRSGK